MLQKHSDKLLQINNPSDTQYKFLNDDTSHRKALQPSKKYLIKQKPRKYMHKNTREKQAFKKTPNNDSEEESKTVILAKEPTLLQKLKKVTRMKSAGRKLSTKSKNASSNNSRFQRSTSDSPMESVDSSEGPGMISAIRSEIEQNTVNKSSKNMDGKESENPKTLTADLIATKQSSKANTQKKKRRRRAIYSLKRRTNSNRKTRVKSQEQEEIEEEFAFGNLAVLNIPRTNDDFWNQGLDHIVELQSSIGRGQTSNSKTLLDKLVSQTAMSKRVIRRTAASKARKPKHLLTNRGSLQAEIDSEDQNSIENSLDENIRIHSKVTDVGNDGVVNGILWLTFTPNGQTNSTLNSKISAENMRRKLYGSNTGSRSCQIVEDDDSLNEYQQRRFKENELELVQLSKRIKKEQEDAPAESSWGKFGRDKISAKTWTINVKMEQEDARNGSDQSTKKNKSIESKQKSDRMSIHDVNKLFEMDPINVEFL